MIDTEIATRWRNMTAKGKVFVAVVVMFALLVLWFAFRGALDSVHDWNVNRKDAAFSKEVALEADQAAFHKALANADAAKRAVVETEYNQLAAQLAAAKQQSRRSQQRLNEANNAYQKVISNSPVDSDRVVLSDAELCARLAALNIDCRQ